MFLPSRSEHLSKGSVLEPVDPVQDRTDKEIPSWCDGFPGYALSAAEKVKYRRNNCNKASNVEKKEKLAKIKTRKKTKNVVNKLVSSNLCKSTRSVREVQSSNTSTSCQCKGCRLPPCGHCTVCKGSARRSESKLLQKCESRICHRGGFVWRTERKDDVVMWSSVETGSRIRKPIVALTKIEIPRQLMEENLKKRTLYSSDDNIDTESATRQDRDGLEQVRNPEHINVHITDSEDESRIELEPGKILPTLLQINRVFSF